MARPIFLKDKILSTENPAFVMGIVNANGDSFWEKSRGGARLAKRLVEQGADILDVGGESTRPGSEYIDAKEELRRVIPLVKKIRKFSDVPISIDTRKYDVMSAAFDAGANILNDVSALEDDPRLAQFAAREKIPVILMHNAMKKNSCKPGRNSAIMNERGEKNIFSQVDEYLAQRAQFALQNGIAAEKIILDPGIGFGKDTAQNAALIKNAGKLCGGKYSVLMALSRKSFFEKVCGRKVAQRLWGTIAANAYSILNGVSIVRVHDVAAAVDTVKVLKEILNVCC